MDVPQLNTTMPVLPIVLSSSEYFLPFVDVLIQSIMANRNTEFFYDFIVLNGGLSAKSCAQSLKAVKKLKNMSLRFLNITPAMKRQL